jgi:hypothetical protein
LQQEPNSVGSAGAEWALFFTGSPVFIHDLPLRQILDELARVGLEVMEGRTGQAGLLAHPDALEAAFDRCGQ